MALIWKKGLFFTYFSSFLVTKEKTIIPSAHISLTDTYFAHPIDFPILKKMQIYHAWFLFGATPGVDPYSGHFGAKFKLEYLSLIFIYTNAKFIVICKTQTLNGSRQRLSSIHKRQKGVILCMRYFVNSIIFRVSHRLLYCVFIEVDFEK